MFQNINILLLLISSPIIYGALCMILPDKLKGAIKLSSFFVTLFCFALSIFVFMIKPVSWQFGANRMLTADNLSGFVGMAIAFFAFLIALYSSSFIEKSLGRYFGYFLITLGSALGAVFANDMIALIIFWGILAATLYLLVSMQGTNAAAAAAKKALIIIGGTDALMIFGIAIIWELTGTFAMDKIHLEMKGILPIAAYMAIAVAALAKAGAMPFHSWLPDVAEFAPTSVTAYLPASLDKFLGIYILARISLHLFVMNGAANAILALIGAVTIIFAVIFALVQHDLKRLLGYHAVSQVGYMVLGIGTGSAIGIAGGLFHMLNNAIYKSCLFLSGGNVEKKTGTTDLDRLGGLARYMPVTFATFLVASLSISGIPPFNGFVSKWMIYQGIIESAKPGNPIWIVWLVCAMFGSALTVASFMKLLHAVFLGRPERDFAQARLTDGTMSVGQVKEAGLSMLFPVIVLAVVCAAFGIFAFVLPLPILILPAVGLGISYLGTWHPVIATALIIIGIIAGIFIYALFRLGKSSRVVPQFIGGEEADSIGRISGVDFYNTMKDVKALDAVYKREASGSLDIYNIARAFIYSLTKRLQALHNGVLPTYMVWCLLGMAGLFLIIFFR